MKKKENKMQDDFKAVLKYLNEAKSHPAREAVSAIKALRSQVKKMNDLGYRKEQINKIQNLAMEAIKLDLLENNATELDNLKGSLALIENAWKRDYENNYSKHSRTIEEASRRYAAMNKDELVAEVDKVLMGNYPELPQVLDELSIAVKQESDDKYQDLRAAIKARNLDKPWMNCDLSQDINNDISILESNKSAVLFKDENNKTFGLNIDMVDDFLSQEEKEAENE
jgi:hypothetical protein